MSSKVINTIATKHETHGFVMRTINSDQPRKEQLFYQGQDKFRKAKGKERKAEVKCKRMKKC